VKKGFDEFIAGPKFAETLDRIVREVLATPEYRWFWFVKHMQARMMEVDKRLDGKRAWEIALTAYKEFLRSERIQFGDPRYTWDRDGARDLIQSLEIDHWEAA
jgi:hypothetical protein